MTQSLASRTHRNAITFGVMALKAISPNWSNTQDWEKVAKHLLEDLAQELQHQLNIRNRRDPTQEEDPEVGRSIAVALHRSRMPRMDPEKRADQRKAIKWAKGRVDGLLAVNGELRNIATVGNLLDIMIEVDNLLKVS